MKGAQQAGRWDMHQAGSAFGAKARRSASVSRARGVGR